MNALEMKTKSEQLKVDAQAFLDSNDMEKAEKLTEEVKVLNAQIEIQEKLDVVNGEMEDVKVQVSEKIEEVTNVTAELEAMKLEKEELSTKYNEATDKVTELNEQVTNMKPIVDQFYQEEKEALLASTQEVYQAKFEKVSGAEVFATEEIQALVQSTLDEDKDVANHAKISLSDKVMELFDGQDISNIKIGKVQEKAKDTGKLDPAKNDFKEIYGFEQK